MDTNGARHLAVRIAQQQHWELAQAVRDGRQPSSDPDGEQLEALGDGCRVYTTEVTNGATGPTVERFLKTLVDGSWELAAFDERSEAPRGEASTRSSTRNELYSKRALLETSSTRNELYPRRGTTRGR